MTKKQIKEEEFNLEDLQDSLGIGGEADAEQAQMEIMSTIRSDCNNFVQDKIIALLINKKVISKKEVHEIFDSFLNDFEEVGKEQINPLVYTVFKKMAEGLINVRKQHLEILTK